ncbi:MAG: helix-turn-helix transcriptional regulator [Elusimicrobia bacterium]|nr:helix-turn-helix transcriptional regulator [Elusimicrobiota bacterium]MBU2613985.1 helix-turn-helix transcriptional regulator [Elusimicrobiota bacterium]
MTQKELAKRLHTTQQTVSALECPNHNVTIGTLEKIAEVLGVELQINFISSKRVHA